MLLLIRQRKRVPTELLRTVGEVEKQEEELWELQQELWELQH